MSLYTKTYRAETGPNVVAVIDPNMGAYGRAIAHFNDRGADLETAQRHANAFIASQEMLKALKEITELAGNTFSEPSCGDIDHYKAPLKAAQAKAHAALAKAGGCNQVDDAAAIDQLSGEAS